MICISYTYGENYQELADLCIPSLIKYCKKRNYHWDINCVKPNDNGNYSFIRINHARKLLDLYEVVLILEGDMMITSMNYKVEDFISNPEKHFYISSDVNGANSASFIAIKSKATIDLLNTIWYSRDIYGDEQNFFEKITINIVEVLPHPSINSIPYQFYKPSYGYINWESIQPPPILPTHEQGCWQKGDWICHCPGKSLLERISIFKEIQKEIVYE